MDKLFIKLAGEQLKRELTVCDDLPAPIRKALRALPEAELRYDKPQAITKDPHSKLKSG